jgi:hypothetical protein
MFGWLYRIIDRSDAKEIARIEALNARLVESEKARELNFKISAYEKQKSSAEFPPLALSYADDGTPKLREAVCAGDFRGLSPTDTGIEVSIL